MKKSKCEKMSKAQKAAEKYVTKEDDVMECFRTCWPNKDLELIQEYRQDAFIQGAEALLRYAKKNGIDGTRQYILFDKPVVSIELLEEWVKGEG